MKSMLRAIALLLACLLLSPAAFAGGGDETLREGTLTVGYAGFGELPDSIFTSGHLYCRDFSGGGISTLCFAFDDFTEPVTDVAFCAVMTDDEGCPMLGNVLWALADVMPGDTMSLRVSLVDHAMTTAFRYTDAGGETHAYAPWINMDGELTLVMLMPFESGEVFDRAEVEAEAEALHSAYASDGDSARLTEFAALYQRVIDADPWADWAYAALGKVLAYDLEEWQSALDALDAAVSLGKGDSDEDTRIAWAVALDGLICALDSYDEDFGFYDPTPLEWAAAQAGIARIEQIIWDEPDAMTARAYECYGSLLFAAGRSQDSHVAWARSYVLDDPSDPWAYQELYSALNNAARFDEAAEVFDGHVQAPSANAVAAIRNRADAAYEAGAFEEAIALYWEMLDADPTPQVHEDYPLRVWHRLVDAYACLTRYDDALAVFERSRDYGPAAVLDFNEYPALDNQYADVLLRAGRKQEALEHLEEVIDFYGDLPSTLALIDRANAMLPELAAKAFSDARWDMYEPVATAYHESMGRSPIVVTVMRSKIFANDDVLCVLAWDEGQDAYQIAVEANRALKPWKPLPRLRLDDYSGSIVITCTEEGKSPEFAAQWTYIFCPRWYWEEVLQRPASGDWQWMLLEASCAYPEPHDLGDVYGTGRLSMRFSGGELCLRGRWEPGDSDGAGWVELARIDADITKFDLAAFRVEQCGADFYALTEAAGREEVLRAITAPPPAQ